VAPPAPPPTTITSQSNAIGTPDLPAVSGVARPRGDRITFPLHKLAAENSNPGQTSSPNIHAAATAPLSRPRAAERAEFNSGLASRPQTTQRSSQVVSARRRNVGRSSDSGGILHRAGGGPREGRTGAATRKWLSSGRRWRRRGRGQNGARRVPPFVSANLTAQDFFLRWLGQDGTEQEGRIFNLK